MKKISIILITAFIIYMTVVLWGCKKQERFLQPLDNCIYLDFDGENVKGVYWNNGEAFTCKSAGLKETEINKVVASTKNFYAGYDVTVTDNLKVYDKANSLKKIQIIITPTHDFAAAGEGSGRAFIGSMFYGSNTPAFVFPDRIFNPEYVGNIVAHEVGHSIGLLHDINVDGSLVAGLIMGNPLTTSKPVFTNDEVSFIKSKL